MCVRGHSLLQAFAHWVYYRAFGCIWRNRDELVRQLILLTQHEIGANVRQLSVQAFQAMALPFGLQDLYAVRRLSLLRDGCEAFFEVAVPRLIGPPHSLMCMCVCVSVQVMRKHAQQFAQRMYAFREAFPPVPPRAFVDRTARLRVGYVSSAAFNNHVRAHLVQSLFGALQPRFEAFCYALAPDDGSRERQTTSGGCEVGPNPHPPLAIAR